MSFKSKFMLVLLVLIVMGFPLIMQGPDGRPIMTLNDWIPNLDQLPVDKADINGVVDQLQQINVSKPTLDKQPIEQSANTAAINQLQAAPTSFSTSSGKMYKWQDEKGRWHFSNQKPMTKTLVTMEAMPQVENVMEAPVNKGENSSSIRLPGGFDLGQ